MEVKKDTTEMLLLLTEELIFNAQQQNVWDFGNNILYDLCHNNFQHQQEEHILTKVLFIGRIYAAAVERRRNKKYDINDDFYINTIARTFKHSTLDRYLSELRQYAKLSIDLIIPVLQTHYYLTATLKKITELEKRSFCSKYLHFHLPNLFFIYDSRALNALRTFKVKIPREMAYIQQCECIDKEYADFFCKCFLLTKYIEKTYNLTLSNRQLDNLLIEVANKQMNEKLSVMK